MASMSWQVSRKPKPLRMPLACELIERL